MANRRDRTYYESSIWCYTDKLSFLPGETIGFRVSNPEPTFACKISRIGVQEVVVFEQVGYTANPQEIPDDVYRKGCQWPIAFELKVPLEWISGYYRVQLIAEQSDCEHFVVIKNPDPGKKASIAIVLATNTYHAYNSWGGMCLYGTDDPTVLSNPKLDVKGDRCPVLSMNRPFSRYLIASPVRMRLCVNKPRGFQENSSRGEFVLDQVLDLDFPVWDPPGGFLNRWEHQFVKWAEENGFELDFYIQYDLDENPECLFPYQCYLSVGHDEYWTWAERDAVESFTEQGGKAFFMCGNACYWQVRFYKEGREMVCYKYDTLEKDPIVGTKDEKYMSGMWSDPMTGRPETQMMGTTFTRAGYARIGLAVSAGVAGYTVHRPDHWALEGTELFYGDVFGQENILCGYEMDGCDYTIQDGLPVPTGEDGTSLDFEIIATAPASLGEPEDTKLQGRLGNFDDSFVAKRIFGADTKENRDRARRGQATMGTFKKGRGEVFSVGTTEWAWGLADGNPYVDRITRNVLDRFLGRGKPEQLRH